MGVNRFPLSSKQHFNRLTFSISDMSAAVASERGINPHSCKGTPAWVTDRLKR